MRVLLVASCLTHSSFFTIQPDTRRNIYLNYLKHYVVIIKSSFENFSYQTKAISY